MRQFRHLICGPIIVLALLLALPAVARDEAEAAEDGATPEETARESIGLNLDLGFATAYVFRGANVFQEDGQMNQNMLLAPGITWSIFDTGLSIGYWGAFQISGNNIGANIDGALGVEQDLFLAYELSLPHDLGLSFGLVYYFYPAADENVAGASVPSYLEPGVGFGYFGVLDVGINIAYFLGLQDEPGIRGISYLYVNPYVGKSFDFNEHIGLTLGLGYGFKLWKEGNDGAANVHDVTLTIGVPIRPAELFYITPGVNFAWTNVPSEDFGGELVFWGGLNLGVDL